MASCGVLILGTSHVGKTTCATKLAERLGWSLTSTDKLGRHPGRPWTGVPAPVIEFYTSLSDDAIHWFLRVHHQNIQPVIGATIEDVRGSGFILEGAALRPEYLADWNVEDVLAVCLTADDAVLRDRIFATSGYAQQPNDVKTATDRFIERSLRENKALVEAAQAHRVEVIDVFEPDETVAQIIALLT